MRHFFTDHARERAEEHYGRHFDPVEINDIFQACMDGHGLCGRLGDDGTATYRLGWLGGLVVVPVIARQRSFIVTFLPSNFFAAGHRLHYGRETGTLKQVFGTARHASKPYRRERFTLKDAMEEG